MSNDDAQFRGKVVLVNISGSWCPNCHDEAPFLAALHRKYQSTGLEVVTLSFEEADQLANPTRLRAFIDQYGIGYTVLLAGVPDDVEAKVPQAVNLNAFPTTFLLGRDGRVRAVHTGFPSPGSGEFYSKAERDITEQIEACWRSAGGALGDRSWGRSTFSAQRPALRQGSDVQLGQPKAAAGARHKFHGAMAKWLTRRPAKPLFEGSNPSRASNLPTEALPLRECPQRCIPVNSTGDMPRMEALVMTTRGSVRAIGLAPGVAVLLIVGTHAVSAQRPSRDDAFSVCQQELQYRMSREIGGRQPDAYVDERRTQISQASNSETRVRGNGRYMRDSNDRGRDFSFDCTYNARDNAARADYSLGKLRKRRRPVSRSGIRAASWRRVDSGRACLLSAATSSAASAASAWTSRDEAIATRPTCNSGPAAAGSNQKWDVIELGRERFAIISRGSNKALTVSGGGRDGANIEQFRWSGGENQRWRLDKGRQDDTYQIVSVSHDSCLDVEGAKREDGANVQLWGCSGGANQTWVLRK